MNDSSPADDNLDTLLRDWSHDHGTDASTIERLHRSVVSNMAIASVVAVETKSRQASVAVAVCAVAASLLMAVLIGSRSESMVSSNQTDAEARNKLTSLWRQTDQLFGSDLEWICDLDGELLLGVRKSDRNASANRVCVTLTVRVFDPVTQRWNDAWSGRVACPGGTPVDFTSSDRQSTGSIWVQSRPDGGFAVSHWLSWQDHPELSGPIEAVVTPNRTEVVAEKMSDGQRIQVVQQVWRLDA